MDQFTLSGEYVATFNNASFAARALGKKYGANISATCLRKRKSCFGYNWKYTPQPDIDNEVWLHHPTISVKVSNKGRIENKNGRRTFGSKATNGYMNYMENGKSIGVHRLIAMTFLSETISEVVHHKDRNRSNNLLENLEWTTQKKNVQAYHSLIPKLY